MSKQEQRGTSGDVGDLAQYFRDQLRERYGYRPCDPRWVDVLRSGEDAGSVASLLAQDHCDSLVRQIAGCISEPFLGVRRGVAWLLGQLGGDEAIWPLISLLGDKEEQVVEEAGRSLCRRDAKMCHALFSGAALFGSSGILRTTALKQAGRSGYRFQPEDWLRFLNDEDASVIDAALEEIPCGVVKRVSEIRERVTVLLKNEKLQNQAHAALERCGPVK